MFEKISFTRIATAILALIAIVAGYHHFSPLWLLVLALPSWGAMLQDQADNLKTLKSKGFTGRAMGMGTWLYFMACFGMAIQYLIGYGLDYLYNAYR